MLNILFLCLLCMGVVVTVWVLFYMLSFKTHWDKSMFSTFECGFSSYFFSRFSFSIHYLLVALIFLFLDLEICVVMPMFNEFLSDAFSIGVLLFILTVLLMGLLEEWRLKKLDWNF